MFSCTISCFLRNPDTAPNFASLIILFVNILSISFVGMKGWWSRIIGLIPSIGFINYINHYDISPNAGKYGVDIGISVCAFVLFFVLFVWLDRYVSFFGYFHRKMKFFIGK